MSTDATNSATNVQQLLDSLGAPPVEVCVDWAWQILNYPDSHAANNASSQIEISLDDQPVDDLDNESASLQNNDLAWSQWTLTEEGQLRHCSTADLSKTRARQVAQLLDWAGAVWPNALDQPDGSDRLRPEVQRRVLESLTMQLNAGTSLKTTSAASSNKSIRSSVISRSSTANRSPRKYTKKKTSRSVHFAIGFAIPIALLGVIWYVLRKPDTTTGLPASGLNSSTSVESENYPKPDRSQLNSLKDSQVKKETSFDSNNAEPNDMVLQTTEMLTAGSDEFNASPAAKLNQAMPRISRDTVANSLGGLLDDADKNQLPDQNFTTERTSTKQDAALPADETSVVANAGLKIDQELDHAAPLDEEIDPEKLLAGAVNELTRGEKVEEPVVIELEVDSVEAGPRKIAAQEISPRVMMQVQKLPEKILVKEPLWHVQLVPSGPFSIEPKEPQRLWGKTIASWKLVPTDMKQRKENELVQILVQGQLAGRRPDIRWKITASAKDLPWMIVPLDVNRLEPMRASIMELKMRTNATIESLKALSRSGSPRSVGPSLYQQRKVLEEHFKVLESIERVIVDASLYVTWLGESIKVHGKLVETVDPKMPSTVLHVGDGIIESTSGGTD